MKRVLLICAWLIFSLSAQAAPKIMVFGDSLSAGYGLPQNTGWVTLLQKYVEQSGLDYEVVNASISGETTQGGRYRINEALKKYAPKLVILELGANDGLRGLPIAAMRENLEAIIQACRKNNASILLIGMQLPPNYGPDYTQKFQAVYSKLGEKHHVALVPSMFKELLGKPGMFQADGLHPDLPAQPIIAGNIWRKLEPLLSTRQAKPRTNKVLVKQ